MGSLRMSGLFVILFIVSLLVTLIVLSVPSLKAFGFHFITGTTWDPVAGVFGALPFLIGTLLTSFLALLISIPFSLCIGLFLGEYFQKGILSNVIRSTIGLLAGIPSVIFGFWGLFFITPIMRDFEIKFGIMPYGVGIAEASLILSIMILPYSASIAQEVINLTPKDLKEAAYSLSCTRFEVIRKVIIPYTSSGILAGVMLALGRAIGETMAVTMVIGNSNNIPHSLFDPSNTMASVIANEFTEATGKLYPAALIEVGVLLFVITTIINILGKSIIKRLSPRER